MGLGLTLGEYLAGDAGKFGGERVEKILHHCGQFLGILMVII
jgi:hypothetical protein